MRRWHYLLVLGLLAGGVVFYALVDPASARFIPKCIYHTLTGWECPACGTQRAFHALLQGEFDQAVRYNPFIILLSPYLLALLYTTLSKSTLAARWRPTLQHPVIIAICFIITIAWWIFRNTAYWHNLIG